MEENWAGKLFCALCRLMTNREILEEVCVYVSTPMGGRASFLGIVASIQQDLCRHHMTTGIYYSGHIVECGSVSPTRVCLPVFSVCLGLQKQVRC